jgi:TonB family protein
MMIYEDPSMFSGRKGAALAGVALLHVIVISGFYFGFAQPIIRHFTAPITVSNIPRPQEKVTVRPEPPKLDDRKLQIDAPENPWNLPADPDTAVTVDRTPVVPTPTAKESVPVRPVVAATAVQMDPKHPLKFGPDYYPAGAVRREQEGRCIVQVTVAPDGKIVASSLQSSSGFPLLDEACLSAVRGQRMVPATQDGKVVRSTASVPIVWKLNGSR